MKHTVAVHGIKLYAYHGCLDAEAAIGGHYIVDVIIQTDFSDAMHSDELDKTVDYVDVNNIVKREMAIRSKLIEHVGQRIHTAIHNEIENTHEVEVKITKLTPPINGDVDHVAITIRS